MLPKMGYMVCSMVLKSLLKAPIKPHDRSA